MTSPYQPANENQSPIEGMDDVPHIETPQQQVEPQEQSEIDQLHEEVARLKDQWVRAAAETDNIRKRSQREQEETSRYAVTGFAGDMVTVLENLKRASESVPVEARSENALLKTIAEGVDLTLQEMLGIFQRYQIKRIDPQGQKFDHNFQQAVAQVDRDDIAPGTVVQVVQAGYIIHDRLLRPAMVVVSKSGELAKKVDTTA